MMRGSEREMERETVRDKQTVYATFVEPRRCLVADKFFMATI